ncbi:hypothetical protein [Hymenobacter arcticus]
MDKAKNRAATKAAHAQGDIDAEKFELSSITSSASEDFRHRLWSVEAQLAPLTFEVAFLYSADGTECKRVKGTATTICIELTDEQQEQMQDGILTHNHPDGSFFSLEDIRLSYKLNLTELRAVRKGEPAQVLSTRLPIRKWLTLEKFNTYWEREENLHYQQEVQRNDEQGRPLQSAEAVMDKANETWPAYFQSRLIELGFEYEEAVLVN